MDSMQKTIGAGIAALRRAKGLTQEQLAAKLGVSAPAVSKWETGNSCPDIALLCPLARALGTNVDTLLQFEQTLSDAEATEKINAILGKALQGKSAEIETELEKLLREYPGCTALQYNVAAAYDALSVFFPDEWKEKGKAWRTRKRELLEEVRATGNAAYWQGATLQLAGIAIADGELDKGAALLNDLPQRIGDPDTIWALYYLKKGDPEQALELTQKHLYRLVNQMQTCLGTLMNPKLIPEPERQLKLGRTMQAIAQMFGLLDTSGAPRMEAWLSLGDTEKAAECFAQCVDAITSPVTYPDEDLFSPGISYQKQDGVQATTASLRRMLLQGVSEEEKYRPLFENPVFLAAVEKLKASV